MVGDLAVAMVVVGQEAEGMASVVVGMVMVVVDLVAAMVVVEMVAVG